MSAKRELAVSAYCGLLSLCFQSYVIRWCNLQVFAYCWPLNTTNVTVTHTQFKMQLYAGDSYNFYVRAKTAYGEGKESNIKVIVPPLDLKVRYASGYTTGRNYGLEVSLHWSRPWEISYREKLVSTCFLLVLSKL